MGHGGEFLRQEQNDGGDGPRPSSKRGSFFGVVETVEGKLFYSNLFLVPQKDGGQRSVIYLKAIYSQLFKMEGIHRENINKTRGLVGPGRFESCILYYPNTHNPKKISNIKGGGKSYHFICLSFSLSSASWVMTIPVTALIRELGVHLVLYMENMLLMAETSKRAQDQAGALIILVVLLDPGLSPILIFCNIWCFSQQK